MIARAKMLVVVGTAALICTLLASLTMYRRSGEAALGRSVEVLLAERLKVSYRIERSALHAETDQNRQWWIVLSERPRHDIIAQWNSILTPADVAELPYYRAVVAESLSPSVALDNFDLLRGAATLGPGSICEQLPCTIAVLVRPDAPDMFVMISKI